MLSVLGGVRAGRLGVLALVCALAVLGAGSAGGAVDDLSPEFAAHAARADALLQAAWGPAPAATRTIALAKAATRAQAAALGLAWTEPPGVAHHAAPGAALAELARLHGMELAAGQAHAVDSLGEPLRSSLTRLVDAFLAFDAAVRLAASPADAAPILAARNALLDAALELETTAAAGPLVTILLCPAFALDLAGTDSTYTAECALVVDIAGNDAYRNNAGGARFPTAAALVDLDGSDRYGDPLSTRSGVNGGATGGLFVPTAGFLFDGGGSDRYAGGASGVNGGGEGAGLGHLVDIAGNDTYTGAHGGVNGGGSLFGVGLLVDGGGVDTYTANGTGVNGGGFAGKGALIDAGGNDAYEGTGLGVNGGGYVGNGLLVDAAGDDRYTATAEAVNGGGNNGLGLLLDGGGRDAYLDQDRFALLAQACSGAGTDRTVIPKCHVGAQMDVLGTGGNPPPAPSGAIAGAVTDAATKGGIGGAVVDCGAGGRASTGADGKYRIAGVRAGTYTCTASAAGYKAKSQSVTVNDSATATANFALRKG